MACLFERSCSNLHRGNSRLCPARRWGNFQAFGWQKYARYGAGWAIWVVLLAASASLQYGLTRLAETERTERITLTRFEATEVRLAPPGSHLLACSRGGVGSAVLGVCRIKRRRIQTTQTSWTTPSSRSSAAPSCASSRSCRAGWWPSSTSLLRRASKRPPSALLLAGLAHTLLCRTCACLHAIEYPANRHPRNQARVAQV